MEIFIKRELLCASKECCFQRLYKEGAYKGTGIYTQLFDEMNPLDNERLCF